MDGHKYPNDQFLSSQPLMKKMIPQILLSVSIFSFVFSYSSKSSLMQSPKFHYYFSAADSSFQLLSHALNKNCLFLICNGLLVFLAKTSGFIRPPPSDNSNINLNKRIGGNYGLQMALEAKEPFLIENYTLEEIRDNKEELKEEEKEKCDQRAEEVSIIIAESEEEERESDQCRRSCWLFDDDEEEQLVVYDEQQKEEEEKGEECLSTQELNQRFENFIRRMKEDIMINEATTHKGVMLK